MVHGPALGPNGSPHQQTTLPTKRRESWSGRPNVHSKALATKPAILGTGLVSGQPAYRLPLSREREGRLRRAGSVQAAALYRRSRDTGPSPPINRGACPTF